MIRKPTLRADVLYCLRLQDGGYSHRSATIAKIIDADLGWVDLAVIMSEIDDRLDDGSGNTPQVFLVCGVEHSDFHASCTWHYLGEVP